MKRLSKVQMIQLVILGKYYNLSKAMLFHKYDRFQDTQLSGKIWRYDVRLQN